MTEAGRMLKEVYLQTAERDRQGFGRFSRDFQPIWENIKQDYENIETIPGLSDFYDMYDICYSAGLKYDETVKRIGIDDAFSSVICAIGVSCYSSEWYKIMAHHYIRQAERKCQEQGGYF